MDTNWIISNEFTCSAEEYIFTKILSIWVFKSALICITQILFKTCVICLNTDKFGI